MGRVTQPFVRAWRWFIGSRIPHAVLGYIVLCLGIALAISLAFLAIHEVRDRDNRTRCSVVHLVAKLSENSARMAQATLDSHTATAAQKQAATRNLATVTVLVQTTRELLGHPSGKDCGVTVTPALPLPTIPAP